MKTDIKVKELLDAAREARKKAYAPYSQYHVGAAVLAGGKIYSGCNVENVSYGLTVCAERIAIFKAVFEGGLRVDAVAVAAGQKAPKSPCGACLQVIAEFISNDDAPVVLVGSDGDVIERQFKDLVPYPCRIDGLKKN